MARGRLENSGPKYVTSVQQLETPKMHNTVQIYDETYKKSEQTQARRLHRLRLDIL